VPRRTKKLAAMRRTDPAMRSRLPGAAGRDDTEITALNLKPAKKLSKEMAAYFKLCEEKLGFVPNVLKAFSFDMAKLEAFVACRNNLMQGESGLSGLDREMIATVVSAQNRCFYCITAHGASVRHLSDDPVLGELMAMNFRAARLGKRQRAMAGFSDRDIWDIAAVAAFYNMTNRLASATDMRPNSQYHAQAR
jgi:AhpD family alkylhydroperoxidase